MRFFLLTVLLALSACHADPPQSHTSENALKVPDGQSTASLQNTYWKLLRLGSAAVTVTDNHPEPHFILHPDDHRVSGSGGCNRIVGSYELEGDRLKFSRMAGTMRACPSGMELERAFHEALGRVAAWKITGEQLELLDSSGQPVADFVSVYLR